MECSIDREWNLEQKTKHKSFFLKVSILNIAPKLLKEDEGCFLAGDPIGLQCQRQRKMCTELKKGFSAPPPRQAAFGLRDNTCVPGGDNQEWSTGVRCDAPEKPAQLHCAVRDCR